MIGKTGFVGLLLSLSSLSTFAQQQSTSVHIAPAGSQNPVSGSVDYFTGSVRVDPLFAADSDIAVSGAYVTFEPGARSAWHTHPAGQRLIVTAGIGLTQQEGQPVQIIRPGDVVSCPPGVKHWHGATPDSAMTHLAVTGVAEGKSVQWMEKVTDEQYHAH
ncbi:quercetin dioxygenase-like cupin family protein [Enterobacter sp. BIGb0383]|uniref:(R)-mandelonitrile lyase n=1 Tax=unclassified Enterobacter TaxID=2608935 RepID=UPI000F470A0F|nr:MULTISPECIES: cupin domain-containing protein [unclassified Enterobacter]ROP59655.1 quercetin dioxygenase-like cupin family protein [Enterobacter sp. BIGb0383]ROS08877.1 quercetin dioxygenase-like cupin family protein [Enterobacter sp. BIGb0359]